MVDAHERPKAVLRALIAFAKQRDRWPDGRELREYRRRLGGRTIVYQCLRFLADRGLVEQRGANQQARWLPTDAGFALLGRPPFRPGLELRQDRADSHLILDQTIRSRATILSGATEPLYASGLDVIG